MPTGANLLPHNQLNSSAIHSAPRLPQIHQPPNCIFLRNVTSFESSLCFIIRQCRRQLLTRHQEPRPISQGSISSPAPSYSSPQLPFPSGDDTRIKATANLHPALRTRPTSSCHCQRAAAQEHQSALRRPSCDTPNPLPHSTPSDRLSPLRSLAPRGSFPLPRRRATCHTKAWPRPSAAGRAVCVHRQNRTALFNIPIRSRRPLGRSGHPRRSPSRHLGNSHKSLMPALEATGAKECHTVALMRE